MSDDAARLRWQCRRGLLELDYLFDGFLDHGYEQLDTAQKQLFRQLLAQPDPVLNAWFMGQEPPEEEYAALVAQIRESVTTSNSPKV